MQRYLMTSHALFLPMIALVWVSQGRLVRQDAGTAQKQESRRMWQDTSG